MFVYPDHNFLIGCIKNPEWRDLVMKSQRSGAVSVVLSPWHCYEYGNARDYPDTEDLVEFVEELQPLWIMERADLQLFEYWVVWNQVWKSAPDEVAPLCTFAQSVSIMSRVGMQAVQKATFRDLVRRFSEDDALEMVRNELGKYQEIAASNRRAHILGKFTSDVETQLDYVHLTTAQARLETRSLDRSKVDPRAAELSREQPIATQFECFIYWGMMRKLKSYQVERAFTRDLYSTGGKLDVNRSVDRQHATICLPYVHVFVTDDRKLRSTCERVIPTLGFPVATVMSSEKFIDTLR